MHAEIAVSVIVLTYNHVNFIGKALDGILMQDFTAPYEILIGDDGSTDGTRDILKKYATDNPDTIRLFLREENLGAAKNAYDLLLNARGKYLAFCEGDDYWTDQRKLSRQVDFLEENPSLIGCSHRCVLVDESGNEKDNQTLLWVWEKERFTLDDFKGVYLPGQTATILKRNIFSGQKDPYPFLYQLNKNISDRTSTLLYLTKGDFGFIPETMSAYRQVEDAGLTNKVYKNNSRRIIDELEYTIQLEDIAKTLTDKKGIFKDYYKQLYAWAVWQYLKDRTAENKNAVVMTAKHIGKGVIHPIAFLIGILKKSGKIK